MSEILDMNGKRSNVRCPTKTGIEEVLRMHEGGAAIPGWDLNHVITCIVFELNRCKKLSLHQSEVIREQDQIIKELTGGRGALTTEDKQQQADARVGASQKNEPTLG